MSFWSFVSVLGSLICVGVIAVAVALEPHPSGHGTTPEIFSPCGYRTLTGDPCLSCGMTTAFVNMVRFRPAAAYRANPAGIALFLLTLVAPFWLMHSVVTRQDPFRFVHHRFGRFLLPSVVVVIVAVWISRTL